MTFADEMKAEDLLPRFSERCLIRTEITTLIGLMMRALIDFTLPEPKVVSDYIEQTEALLGELHQAIITAAKEAIVSKRATEPDCNPFTLGEVLREAIFYSTESAYSFQYRDLAPRKYREDAAWLLRNKDVDLVVGREVCVGIAELLNERLPETLHSFRAKPSADWTILPGFTFSCDELAIRIGRPEKNVRAIVEAFTMPESENNRTFTSLHTFNAAYAYPFIRRGDDRGGSG